MPPGGFPWPEDGRTYDCSLLPPPKPGTKVSFIIPYVEEHVDHLVGTAKSLLYFTPSQYIEEILFVYDGHKAEGMHENALMELSDKIKVHAADHQFLHKGPASVRYLGAILARGEIIVYLEPRVALLWQWLEPLLSEIQAHPDKIVTPIFDTIVGDDYVEGVYVASHIPEHWRLEWNLGLISTMPVPREMSATSYSTPAFGGEIFAIHSDLLRKLDLWDDPQHEYGVDHVEISMKAWRCAGGIKIQPCSRVGRQKLTSHEKPYRENRILEAHNFARLAQVWLKENETYLDTFLKVRPDARAFALSMYQSKDVLDARREKLKELKCKSMDWYLHHVDVELLWETERACIPGCCLDWQTQLNRTFARRSCPVDPGCCAPPEKFTQYPKKIRSEPGHATLKKGDAITPEEYMRLTKLYNISTDVGSAIPDPDANDL